MDHMFETEIEGLQQLRSELENILGVIETQQKTLEEETKILRRKLALQKLDKKEAVRKLLESVKRRREELAGLPIQRGTPEDS